jgi:hypothetical protein
MMGVDETKDGGFFELRCVPDVALVSSVRCFVTDFYGHLAGDSDIAHRLAMATHELLENAVAYSIDRRTEIRIVLRRPVAPHHEMAVDIETKNRVFGDRMALVRTALDEVIAAPDPDALYRELVRRAAKRRDGGSGLGLGRIRAEADLTLSYEIMGDVLAIRARGTFRPRPMLRRVEDI